MLKSDSRSRSLVGRMSCERGPASGAAPKASADDAHAACAWRGGASPVRGFFGAGFGSGSRGADRRVEIGAGRARELLAELVAQHAAAHFLDLAGLQIAELERPVGDADQPVHAEPEMLEHALHLAVLAFAQADGQPEIRALHAVDLRLDRAVDHAVDGDAAAKLVERRLVDLAVRAHAVAPEPAGRGKLQHAREPAVIGEEQQALGVDVEPADRHHARQVRRKRGEDRRPALRVAVGGDEALRLVEEPEPRALARGERLAVDLDAVGWRRRWSPAWRARGRSA